MAKRALRHRNLLSSMALCAAVAACSVLNSYDDVVPLNDDGSAGKSNNAGKGGQSTAGSPEPESEAGAGGVGGATPTSMGGVPAENGGQGGTPDLGPPTTGLVVLGGKLAKGVGDALLTLDPEDGSELSREVFPGAAVVGLAYDGAAGKNLWFVFTSGDFPASSMSKADLQIRTYADVAKKWTTRRKVTALPPPRPGSLVVLNDRLAYLSYGLVNNVVTDTLTILDTSSPASTKQVTFDIPLTGRVLGLVGTRGVPGDVSALGGTLAVATGDGCTGVGPATKCSALSIAPIFVGDEISAGAVKKLRGFQGRTAFTSSAMVQRAFVALPAVAANGNIDVMRFDPRAATFELPLSAPTPAKNVAALAIVDCLDVTVFSSVADFSLWATSAQGTSVKTMQTHEAQDVVYEPFTSSIITPYNPDSPLFPAASGAGGAGGAGPEPDVRAFRVAKPGATPSVKLRTTDWAGLKDVAVNVVATRYPVPFSCP